MKTSHKISAGIFLAVTVSSLLAQQPRITSFAPNGSLTWTNAAGTNAFILESASSLAGAWSYAVPPLDLTISTDVETTVSVPVVSPMGFYRLLQGFGPQTLHGTWMIVGPAFSTDSAFIAFDGSGAITNFAVYYFGERYGAPPSSYSISNTGGVTLTVISNSGGSGQLQTNTVTGQFEPPRQINFNIYSTSLSGLPVTNISLCAGNWSGTLTETNDPNGLSDYSINLAVNTNGFVNLSGDFTGAGWIFALAPTNGTIASFFYTTSTGNYDQFGLGGILNSNVITGSFGADSGSGAEAVDGTFTLTRQ
ncbi:MAG TPA: hypothetical protein VMF08_07390 [Candidatus Sulfotelmatobacter sp.]|nr:hypothetical protein [Candidatus Sulfotelmatobacter sp.]